jgi:hypothetical protein
MAVVGQLKLRNTGAFVARLGAGWKDQSGEKGGYYNPEHGDILEGHSGSLDPGKVGCPAGATVWAYAKVVMGESRSGSENDNLIYEPGDTHVAEYHVHGSATDTHMSFNGVQLAEEGS